MKNNIKSIAENLAKLMNTSIRTAEECLIEALRSSDLQQRDFAEKITSQNSVAFDARAIYFFDEHSENIPGMIAAYKSYGDEEELLFIKFDKDLTRSDYKQMAFLNESSRNGLECKAVGYRSAIAYGCKETSTKLMTGKYLNYEEEYSCEELIREFHLKLCMDRTLLAMKHHPPHRVITTISFEGNKLNEGRRVPLKLVVAGYEGRDYITLFSKVWSYQDDKCFPGAPLDDVLASSNSSPKIKAVRDLVDSNWHNVLKNSVNLMPDNSLYNSPLQMLIQNHIKNDCGDKISLESPFVITDKIGMYSMISEEAERFNSSVIDVHELRSDFFASNIYGHDNTEIVVYSSHCLEPTKALERQSSKGNALLSFSQIFKGRNFNPEKQDVDGRITAPSL